MTNLALPPAPLVLRPRVALGGALIFGAALLSALGACVAVYFQARSTGSSWPPPKTPDLNNFIGLMTTVTMVLSAMTAVWALTSLGSAERRPLLLAVIFTTGFAIAGLNAVSYVIRDLRFGPADSVYAVVFYAPLILTALAIAVGTASLINVTARLIGRRDGVGSAAKLQASVALWLVCVTAWLITYGLLYLVK